MKVGELGREPDMSVGSDQQVVHQGNGADAEGNGGAALDTEVEDLMRGVDPLHGDKRHRVAGENGGIGAIAVRQSRRIDAEADPGGERHEQQIPCLREGADEDDRGGHADDRADQSEAGFLQGLAARRQGEDCDRDRGRRRRIRAAARSPQPAPRPRRSRSGTRRTRRRVAYPRRRRALAPSWKSCFASLGASGEASSGRFRHN